jgi:hypothetical protein
MQTWQKVAIVAVVFFAFWWIFTQQKSGYSLCNLAEYMSEATGMMAPPGMVGSVADMTVPMQATVASAAVDTMAMGSSGYMKRGGCGCGK